MKPKKILKKIRSYCEMTSNYDEVHTMPYYQGCQAMANSIIMILDEVDIEGKSKTKGT